ncbi:hypothetical protein [Thermococcus paralvinellae]|uniref:DNA topoisomerase VI subunit B n=1 Tax=Thermococcus paralvinellae TaxID=582419 RepID=W0I5Z9_9EURY|nr:hypothetical protein [Thermococcus paralvinellae]AHF79828.1 DNA topoisomerase VI subunit B [Thermococcus paralvinellae]
MKFGIPKLDRLLGEINEGSVVLIETLGNLGEEIVIEALKKNSDKSVAFVTKRLKEELGKIPELKDLKYIVFGEDFAPQELFKITYQLRQILNGYLVALFFLQPLLVYHPPETVYKFFSEVSSIAHDNKLVLIAILDKRLIDERTLAMFENVSTHVIEIGEELEKFRVIRGIRIKKSPRGSSSFYELVIKDGKVTIGEPLG